MLRVMDSRPISFRSARYAFVSVPEDAQAAFVIKALFMPCAAVVADQAPEFPRMEEGFAAGEYDLSDSGLVGLFDETLGSMDAHRSVIVRSATEDTVGTGQIAGERVREMQGRNFRGAFPTQGHAFVLEGCQESGPTTKWPSSSKTFK